MKKLLAIILVISLFSLNTIVFAGDTPSTFAFSYEKPEGTISFSRVLQPNGSSLISINYSSKLALCFTLTMDLGNNITKVSFSGGELDFHLLKNGLIQAKVQSENGRSAVLILDKNGNPQNPNGLDQFQNVLIDIYPNLEDCLDSFVNFGKTYDLWNQQLNGSLTPNNQKIISEIASLYGESGLMESINWGCTIGSFVLGVSIIGATLTCMGTGGAGCAIAVIGVGFALYDAVDKCSQ